MKWIRDFQLFLFDFDGLLVNTERLHYQAYANALEELGYHSEWSFGEYCALAHLNSTALKEAIYRDFPLLDLNWNQFYARKKSHLLQLLASGEIELMPGVETLLKELALIGARRAVVTNSSIESIEIIRSRHSALQSIPHWVVREDYEKPKPDPECYLRAIQLYGEPQDRIIGFEDSARGLNALRQTAALPVLVCSSDYPLLEIATEGSFLHVKSFLELLEVDVLPVSSGEVG